MAYLRGESPGSSGIGCITTFLPTVFVMGLVLLGLISYGTFRNLSPEPIKQALSAGQTRVASQPESVAAFFSPSVLHWTVAMEKWAEDYGLDANLVATVMQIESCGDPQALSSAGAAGLFQVMPFHFEAGEDPTDPVTNAMRGLAYLKQSLNASGGDIRKALAGYNGGIGVINQPEAYWPSETRRYADWGSRIYAEATGGKSTSKTLQEWLNSGGSNLCHQASQKLLVSQQ